VKDQAALKEYPKARHQRLAASTLAKIKLVDKA
jgi:hypothetical protein